MNFKQSILLLSRYLVLVILGLNLAWIYILMTPLTVYPLYFILNAIYPSIILLTETQLAYQGFILDIVSACVAGSAYYLLLAINLLTPMDLKKRVYSIIFLVFSFLALNILRIVLFSILLFNGFSYFDITHLIAWYFGSTLMVVLLWFVCAYAFNIKSIPIYSDFLSLLKEIKN